ncbi:MAG: beta-lactamase [Symbiobacteriaceae bacterium]|jgi:CubicO group peptidase (beta-lactamase class C family)|nr:beta-lactamase [Symbiobacteriaceae bacterium]
MMQQKMHQLLQQMSDAGEFSGVVTIRQGDFALYAGAFGLANRAFRVPNTMDTIFGLASVTKMFTSVAVLQLIEQGRLALDTQVAPYLGLEGRAIATEVTVHHLLTHTSGIADYFDDDDDDLLEQLVSSLPRQSLADVASFVPLFADKPARFAPGAQFEYNGAGYILLGLLIEKASGLSYFDYVRQNIFARAGMTDADFIPFDVVRARVAEGYLPPREEGGAVTGWRRNIFSVPPYGAPDGGAFGSAEDMTRFLRALRGGKLISPGWAAAMRTPRVSVVPQISYGYGLYILAAGDHIMRYGHTGEDPGVSARVMYYPLHDLDVVILCNQSGCAGKVLAQLHRWILA